MFKKIFINIVIFIFILSSIVVIGSCIINVNASTTLDSEVEYNEIEIINISEKEFEISFLIENDYQMLNLLDYNIYLIKEETNYKMVFNYYIVDFNSKINNGIIKSITFYEFDIRNDDYKSPYLEIVIYFNDSNSVKLYRCLVNELQFELILNNTKQTENDDINYERLINAVHFKRNYYLEQEVPISLLSKSISNEIGAIQYISLNDTDKWNDIISHYNEKVSTPGWPVKTYMRGAYILDLFNISKFKEVSNVLYISDRMDYALAKCTYRGVNGGFDTDIIIFSIQIVFPGEDHKSMSEARIRFEPISTGHYKYQTKSEYDNYIKNSGYFPELEIGRTEVVYSHLSNEGYDIGLTRLDAKFKVINYDKADLNEEIRYNIVNGKLNINDNGDFIESVEYQERYDKNVNSNITANGVLTFLSTLYGFVTDPVTEGILLILGGIANTIDGESSVENITNIYRGSKRLSNINPSQDIVKNFRLDKEVELNNLYNNQNYTFKNKNYEYVQYQIFMGSKVKLEEVPNKLNVDMNITICHRQYNGDEKNIAFTWNLSKVYNRGLTYLEEGDVHTDIINQGGAFFNYQFVPNESRTYRYEVISDEDINLYLNNENILNYANLNYAIYEKNGKKILVFDIRNEINSINNIKINFQNILAVGTFSISIRQREKNIEINNSYKGEFLYEKDCYYFEYSPEYNTTYFIEIISDIPINVYYYDEICLLSSLGLQENYDGKLYYYTTSFNSEVDMWFMLESRSLGQIGSFSFSLYNDIDLGKIKYVNIVDQETIQINTDNVQIYTFRPEVSKNYRIEISNTNVSLYINGNQINNFKIGNGIIYSEINFSCLLTYRIMIDCDNTCDFAINSGKKMIYSFDNFLNVKVYDLANMSLIDDVNMMVTFYASKVDIANRAVTFDRILVSYYVEEGDPYYGISDFPVGLVFGETYPEMSNSLFLFLFLQQIIDNRYSPDICTFEGFINIDPFNNKDITVTFNETEFRNNLIETYTYEF